MSAVKALLTVLAITLVATAALLSTASRAASVTSIDPELRALELASACSSSQAHVDRLAKCHRAKHRAVVLRKMVVREDRHVIRMNRAVAKLNRLVLGLYDADTSTYDAVLALNARVLRLDGSALRLSEQTLPNQPTRLGTEIEKLARRVRALDKKVRDAESDTWAIVPAVTPDDPDVPASQPAPVPTPVPTATLDVKDYGAHADGVTDDRDHIASCATAAAAAGAAVYFPPGTYRLAGPMSAIAGVYYYAPSGVILRTEGEIYGASECTFDGFAFQSYGAARAISIGSRALVANMTVKNCSFAAGTSQYTHSRIIMWRAHDCRIDDNTFTGTRGSGGNIQLIGGKRNHITDNTITGGTTAILCMWSRSSNGGGANSIIENNVITGNTYSNYSEEGISFDLKANSEADCGALEYDTVAAVSGQRVTLSDLDFPNYVGYDLVFLTGALRGRTRTITAQSDPVFTVVGDIAGVAPGDKVVIGACYKNNRIAYNTGTSYEAGGYSAILLYGLCFGNVIEHNTIIQGKIKVQSLDYTVVATGSATRTHGRAPCGYNTVEDNVVRDSLGRVYLEYYALGGDYTPFVSEGNNVIGNTTPIVQAVRQHAYFEGNTGTELFSSVTKAASPFVYDGL